MQNELTMVTAVRSDIILIDSLQLEIKDYERKIEQTKRKLGSCGSIRSLAKIEEELEDLEVKLTLNLFFFYLFVITVLFIQTTFF